MRRRKLRRLPDAQAFGPKKCFVPADRGIAELVAAWDRLFIAVALIYTVRSSGFFNLADSYHQLRIQFDGIIEDSLCDR